MDYDVFVSHASEDNESCVAPVAKLLVDLGVRVWYDAFTLNVGDRLSKSIDKGLPSSQSGIVVLSKACFAKPWPDDELGGLISKAIGRDHVILPSWHEVTRDDVLAFSPTLADKIASETSKAAIGGVVVHMLAVVRPDLHRHLLRIAWWQKIEAQAEGRMTHPTAIHPGPICQERLPKALLRRMRRLHGVVGEALSLNRDELIDGGKRDAHPAREIHMWETLGVALYGRAQA